MSLAPYILKGAIKKAKAAFASLTTSGDATIGGFVNGSVAGPLTAHAGGGKANATPLTAQFNILGTVATAADSGVLPAAVPGRTCYVFNAGVAAAQIFGAGTDTIDAVATATGVPLTNGKRAVYVCFVAGAWVSAQLGVASA